jgi:putative membrane protein
VPSFIIVVRSCARLPPGLIASNVLHQRRTQTDSGPGCYRWTGKCSCDKVYIISALVFCDLIVGMEQAEISPRPVIGAIVVASGLAVSFLLWLLYVHHASANFAGRWMFLPALNALLNGLCAIALCVGLYFIKHHNWKAHRTSMLLAFAFSSAFLISYIVNHALHGDTIFPGHGPVRTLYLTILASHVILSIVALPIVLTTFFFSLTGRFAMHRRIARWTFPIWLYVSITGVVVFVFLRAYAY